MSRTRLAIVMSLIGVGVPWAATVRADDDAASFAVRAPRLDPGETKIRSVLGLTDERDRPSVNLERRSTPPRGPTQGPSARSAGPVIVDRLQWDAAALGLDRKGGRHATATPLENRPPRLDDESAPSTASVRSILGLDAPPATARMPLARTAWLTSPAASPPKKSEGSASRSGGDSTPDEPPSPSAMPDMPDEQTAMDRPLHDEFVSPLPDVEPVALGTAIAQIEESMPRPRRRQRDEPLPAIADAMSPTARRGNWWTAAALVIPPDEVETLAREALPRTRPVHRSSRRDRTRTAAPAFESNDPLLALLQVLPDGRVDPPLIGAAANPESPAAPDVPADVFRHMTDDIQRLSAASTPPAIADAWTIRSPMPRTETPAADVLIGSTLARLEITRMEGKPFALLEPLLPRTFATSVADEAIDVSRPLPLHVLMAMSIDVSSAQVEATLPFLPRVPWNESFDQRDLNDSKTASSATTDAIAIDIFDPKLGLPRANAPALSDSDRESRHYPLQDTWVALADSKLEEMRGGFETDAGLKIAFGIERAVYINGALVTTTSLNVADLSKISAGQAQSMGLDRATLGLIQSGPNNSFTPNQLNSSSVATVIQNTLNDQKIQGVTQINATVNSLDLIHRADVQSRIQSALVNSIRR